MGVLELLRGLAGNSRSWLYVFEWPFFGLFIYYMYWNLRHNRMRFEFRLHIFHGSLECL